VPEAEIYAESRKEVNFYAESIIPGIRKADEIPLKIPSVFALLLVNAIAQRRIVYFVNFINFAGNTA
jgi:hypothetical protein